jgi:serine/threonine protein kinase
MDEDGAAVLREQGAAPRIREQSSQPGQAGRRLRMGFTVDVAAFGARPVPERDQVQRRLRRLIAETLASCGLPLDENVVAHEWTGDGINATLPADIDPVAVLPVLIRSMAANLGVDNASYADRIRLRMAVGVGVVDRRPAEFRGPLIVDLTRLVDADPLRSALTNYPNADLAVAISDHLHAMVIRPGYPGIPGRQLTRVDVVAKEFSEPAWIWISARQWTGSPYFPLVADDPPVIGEYRVIARLGTQCALRLHYVGRRTEPEHVPAAGTPGPPRTPGTPDPWVAIKVFREPLADDPDARRRLHGGALAAMVLNEPHLTSVLAADAEAVRPWAASTLVRGPSVAAAVAETGPLPGPCVGWLAVDIARAVAALHSRGFAHHAVKPRNVLLTSNGAVLTDFGVNAAALTVGPGTPADDVFRFGLTVCYAATGRAPWDDYPTDHTSLPLAGPAGDPDLVGCPAALVPVVRACLDPDPGRRPAAAALADSLARATRPRPAAWLPGPVALRLAEYRRLPDAGGR